MNVHQLFSFENLFCSVSIQWICAYNILMWIFVEKKYSIIQIVSKFKTFKNGLVCQREMKCQYIKINK